MVRRDYILRMIEECMRVLSRIAGFRQAQKWEEAETTLSEEFTRLVGAGPDAVVGLSETELLARLMQSESTLAVRAKTIALTRLLKEAGDVAVGQDRLDEARLYHLRGLHLLMDVLAEGELFEFPDFVPQIESFLIALEGQPLPLRTEGLLMQHYERLEQFGKAEDALFSMIEIEPSAPGLLDFGIVFYDRLKGKADAILEAGGLPRTEVEAGMAELQQRKAALARPN